MVPRRQGRSSQAEGALLSRPTRPSLTQVQAATSDLQRTLRMDYWHCCVCFV